MKEMDILNAMNEIDDAFILEAETQMKQRKMRWTTGRQAGIALMAVMVLAVGIFMQGQMKQKDNVQIPNPIVEYASKEDAQKASGMTFELPSALDAYQKKYSVIGGEVLQIDLLDENGIEVMEIRKQKGVQEKLSGHLETYDQVITDNNMTFKGSNDVFVICEYEADGYSYSLALQNGMRQNDLRLLCDSIR